jgi:hypothetical protein
MLGLNLLRLLVQNRIAEFHTELELISPEVGGWGGGGVAAGGGRAEGGAGARQPGAPGAGASQPARAGACTAGVKGPGSRGAKRMHPPRGLARAAAAGPPVLAATRSSCASGSGRRRCPRPRRFRPTRTCSTRSSWSAG